MRHTLRLLIAGSAAALVAIMAEVPAGAAEPTSGDGAEAQGGTAADRAALQERLERLRAGAKLSAERQEKLESEVQTLAADEGALQDALMRTSERLSRLERRAFDTEERLRRMSESEALLRRSLAARRDVLAAVLGGLQRIGRRPPPAMVARPDDALGAVRSAILLNAILPDMTLEAEALASDLDEMSRLKSDIERKWRELDGDLAALGQERARVQTLIEEKRRQRAVSAFELKQERRRAARVAEEVATVNELIESVSATPSAGGAGSTASDRVTLGPSVPFGSLQGRLPLPVSGTVLRRFGEPAGDGEPAGGLVVAAAPRSTVFAPADGKVVYSGPFRSYGQLLILDVGDGYHILMAGMQAIVVDLGQVVVAGEPVGRMGTRRHVSAVTMDIESGRPTLYVEFRKGGTAIDSSPWWSTRFAASEEVGG